MGLDEFVVALMFPHDVFLCHNSILINCPRILFKTLFSIVVVLPPVGTAERIDVILGLP